MPTEQELAADSAVYGITSAVAVLWEAYRTPEGQEAIRQAIPGITNEWKSLGALLNLAAQERAA